MRLLPLLILAASPSIGFSQTRECDSLDTCQKVLETRPKSSLAHYRIAEILYRQHNYQSSALEFSQALTGDLEPKWTEVWAHINLGKIFDLTNQRDRAIREYRGALRTGDNTRGALEEAEKYLASPYK